MYLNFNDYGLFGLDHHTNLAIINFLNKIKLGIHLNLI